MTFYDFVISFIEDDTPLGSLANNVRRDKDFPKNETCHATLRTYFHNHYIDHEMLESANRALSLYRLNYKWLF